MIYFPLLPNIAEPPSNAIWMRFDQPAPIPLYTTSSGRFFGAPHLVAQFVGRSNPNRSLNDWLSQQKDGSMLLLIEVDARGMHQDQEQPALA
jgi:hypothetical protein